MAFGLSVAHITQRSLYLGPYITEWEMAPLFGIPVYLGPYLIIGVPIIIPGLLLTLLALAFTSTRQTCCSRPPPNCCCTCFTLPRVEYGALLPSKPYAPFVLDVNGKPKPVPEDEKVKTEETEMVANEEAKKTEKQDDELVANQAEYNLDMDKVMV